MKFFIKLSLFLLCFSLVSEAFSAQKRYKKRHHKVQLSGALNIDNNFRFNDSHLSVNYARNFEMFEVGVLLGIMPDVKLTEMITPDGFSDLGLMVGVLAEYNFIKNKRRNNTVPALGLKATIKPGMKSDVFVTPYLALKSFVSTRTSINVELEYPMMVLDRNEFRFEYWRGVNILVGYAYYFH